MKLSKALQQHDYLLMNGPIKTRLEFEYGIKKADWELIRDGEVDALKAIFSQDIALCQQANIAMVLSGGTFRASYNHMKGEDIESINCGSIEFMLDVTRDFDKPESPVLFAAALGSMYDAYSAELIPSVEAAQQYHRQQLDIFESYPEIDYINVVTLPSLNEALGIALALEWSKHEYTIGFVLDKQGNLLDGHSVEHAIQFIDANTKRQAIGYMIYCTHPDVINLLAPNSRIIGIKANASNLQLHLLASSTKAEADSPEMFAEALASLKERLHLRIISGCCGTSSEHLAAIIENLSL